VHGPEGDGALPPHDGRPPLDVVLVGHGRWSVEMKYVRIEGKQIMRNAYSEINKPWSIVRRLAFAVFVVCDVDIL